MKTIQTVGKRKTAVSRATIRPGKGLIRINKVPIENTESEFLRLKLKEVLEIGKDVVSKVDIDVNTKGGGVTGQVDSTRQAIARGLVKWSKNEKLKKKLIEFDRNLLIYDPRRKEPHKFGRSSAGARRKRQSSKR